MAPAAPPDIPIVVYGHSTDPTKDGYQILYNYESTYWRALVGNMPWGLYEMLRSFCHKQNNVCYPSVNLLLDILGVKERRVLTGWIKVVNGKEYRYPGFIETLYTHKLVVAQIEGEGPKMRYVFHVNLTPGMLTPEQLDQISPLLRKKHGELLERCAEAQRALENTQRPSRVNPPPAPSQNADEGGLVNYQKGSGKLPEGGLVNYQGGSGKLPVKQQPINNTHRTSARARENNNNKKDVSTVDNDVVVALTSHKIANRVAQQLSKQFPATYIQQKIAFHDFLLAERPEDIKKPAAWLRSAIENDYSAPDGFVSTADRERFANEDKRRAEALVATQEANERANAEAERSERKIQEQRLVWLHEQYGLTAEAIAFWQGVQRAVEVSAGSAIHALIADAYILNLNGSIAQIGIQSKFKLNQLAHPGTQTQLNRIAKQIAKQDIALEFVPLEGLPG